jgi:DNA-binding MarR family transcriptional regulator
MIMNTQLSDDGTNTLALELGRLVNEFIRSFKTQEKTKDRFNGITITQWLTIIAFNQEPRLFMHQLSRSAGLSGSTMTRIVDRLVSKGLVRRYSSEEDRRQVCVELTPKGKDLLIRINELQIQFFGDGIKEIPSQKIDEVLEVVKILYRVFKDKKIKLTQLAF